MNSLLDLLPKGGASTVDSLVNETKFFRRILFLIQETEEGIGLFLKGNLSHFDPHVGDTACQIRAYYFALLWTKREEIFPSLERDLVQLKTYAEKIMILMDQSSRNLHRPLRPSSLTLFLEKLGVNLTISELGSTLSIAHILSKYRWVDEEGISQTIDEQKFRIASGDSREFSALLIKKLQKNLCEFSIHFINQCSLEMLNAPGNFQNLNQLLYCDSHGRKIFPCLATVNIILSSIKYISKIAMVVLTAPKADSLPRESRILIFRPSNYGAWSSLTLSDLSENESCLVISAIWHRPINELTFRGKIIEDYLLFDASLHQQYPGITSEQKSIETKAILKKSSFWNFLQTYKNSAFLQEVTPLKIKHYCCARAKDIARMHNIWVTKHSNSKKSLVP